MKTIFLLFLSFLPLSFTAQTNDSFYEDAHQFFQTYCENSRVNYQEIKANSASNALIEVLSTYAYSPEEEKAYLINAYNLFVIHKIVSNEEIASPSSNPNFFTEKTNVLNGKKVSLNEIENEFLRKKYSDPRFHFVLVCGAIGCPPIANFAYTPKDLHNQLDERTVAALNNDGFVYALNDQKTVYLSEIFNWYKTDFGKNNREVLEYINTYRHKNFDESAKISYYPYNWTLNSNDQLVEVPIVNSPATQGSASTSTSLQLFTAGSLLRQGQMDITLFNTLYTESKSNWKGVDYTGFRSTFVTHLLQFSIGATKNNRVNLGLDVSFRSSGRSVDSSFSTIKNAFAYKNNDSSRVGITSLGLRVKVQPFKSVSNFTIQSTFSFPTIQHPEGLTDPNKQNLFWADWDRYTWWNQLFYTKNFGKFQLFTEFDLLFRFRKNKQQIGMLDLPMSAFLSYFPTKKITIYAMTQHVPRFTNDIDQNNPATDWVIPANYTASGIGFKYQLLSNLNIELLYTNFWRSRNAGQGNTFNIGIKYLTKR